MLTVSNMQAVRNLLASPDSAAVRGESKAAPGTPPPRGASSTSLPAAAVILCSDRPYGTRDFSSFFTDGNASGVLPSQTGNKTAWARASSNESRDAGPVVLGGSWPPLSLSSQHSTNSSFEGSPAAQASATSPLMLQNFANLLVGDSNGDGTSGSCSSNDGLSFSSSITRSGEIPNDISDKQSAGGNNSFWDHHPGGFHGWQPQGFHGWVDQGGRQKRQINSSRIVTYGNKHYEHHPGYAWNYYQLRHLRPPVMLPPMPPTTPFFFPPPPPQYIYGPMPNPGFPPPIYMLPTHPHPEYFRGDPYVFPPAPLPAQSSMPFSLEGHTRALIMKQIEYYFSPENLRTDFFLKMHMDNSGWVSIHLIAGFRRIKRLTDDISAIVDALIPSAVVEVQHNRVRRRHGWNLWVLRPPRSQSNTESEDKS